MSLANELFIKTGIAVADIRMQAWTECREAWMATRRSDATRLAYARALEDLLASAELQPWEIGRADMLRWVKQMKQRGLANSTQTQYLAAVSSLYKFAMAWTQVDSDGREVPLATFNPAAGRDLRPKVDPYGKANCLSISECRALLRSIHRDTRQGARDYALFLGYLMTGRRNTEWRTIKWGDLVHRGGNVFHRWSGKGKKDQLFEIAPPSWEALANYMAICNLRLPDPDEYIFQPVTDNATRLPNVNAEKWAQNRNHPITSREVGRLLKVYARRAGLEAEKISVHTLRHSAAMLRREAGDDVQKISDFLGHSNAAVTRIYLHKIEGKGDQSWATVAKALGL